MSFSRRILIVHESAKSRDLLKSALRDSTDAVFEAANVAKAESILNNDPVDLVISSLSLPQRSSIALVKKVKSITPKIPIIVITKKRRVAAFLECSKVGGDGVISYPFNKENIANTLKNTLALVENHATGVGQHPFRPASRYLAGYELKGVLGKGSMGIVYLVEKANSRTAKPYAMKVLQKPVGRSEDQKRELLERFLREAEAASVLRHPNIVRIIDFGIAEEQMKPYIVMDFIPGRSLKHFIGKSGLSHIQKAMIVRQVAHALKAIHSHNICHRDIKPENIIMDEKLNVKVTDFGVARLPNSDLTQIVKILGTPSYMAPEAFISARVDYKADIYSLGVVAYELFLGKKPFYSESINGYRQKILNERPMEPRKIDSGFPRELQCILAKSLKKDPDARFNSVADIVFALDQFLDFAANKVSTTAVDLVEYFENVCERLDPKIKAYEETKLDWK